MHEYPEYPRPAVAAVVIDGGRVLAVKRKNPPAQGTWSVPGGSIKSGESMSEAAIRETLEETGIKINMLKPYSAVDVIQRDSSGLLRFHYIIVYVLAQYVSGTPVAGDDALDTGWFKPEELSNMPTPEGTMDLIFSAMSLLKTDITKG